MSHTPQKSPREASMGIGLWVSFLLSLFCSVLLALAFFCMTLSALAAPASNTPTERRVLFVGNSLTYVNNLPGAFASLTPPGVKLSVDMIARPGASLADYVDDPVLSEALVATRYTDVILQERGGNAFCGGRCKSDPEQLRPLEQTTLALANAIRRTGARIYYLGTWQAHRETNVALELGARRVA